MTWVKLTKLEWDGEANEYISTGPIWVNMGQVFSIEEHHSVATGSTLYGQNYSIYACVAESPEYILRAREALV